MKTIITIVLMLVGLMSYSQEYIAVGDSVLVSLGQEVTVVYPNPYNNMGYSVALGFGTSNERWGHFYVKNEKIKSIENGEVMTRTRTGYRSFSSLGDLKSFMTRNGYTSCSQGRTCNHHVFRK